MSFEQQSPTDSGGEEGVSTQEGVTMERERPAQCKEGLENQSCGLQDTESSACAHHVSLWTGSSSRHGLSKGSSCQGLTHSTHSLLQRAQERSSSTALLSLVHRDERKASCGLSRQGCSGRKRQEGRS